jgi:hypothetical protein
MCVFGTKQTLYLPRLLLCTIRPEPDRRNTLGLYPSFLHLQWAVCPVTISFPDEFIIFAH